LLISIGSTKGLADKGLRTASSELFVEGGEQGGGWCFAGIDETGQSIPSLGWRQFSRGEWRGKYNYYDNRSSQYLSESSWELMF
jgi:hypothetical protein